jgi:hypothetical protein
MLSSLVLYIAIMHANVQQANISLALFRSDFLKELNHANAQQY